MTKVAVVTGSNKGIGYGIVRNLCKQFSGIVYVTSRNEDLGKEAIESLNKIGLEPKYHQLDIDSEESVKKFANFIKEKHGGLDVLVNNAAIAFKQNATESFAVQADITLKTNYFSLLRVCDHLFPLLRPHARVVNLSSSAGHLLRIPSETLRNKFADDSLTINELSSLVEQFKNSAKNGTNDKDGWGDSAYVVSKVAVSALTRIQQRAFDNDTRSDLVVNSVHPGYVITDMTSQKGNLTVEQGADAPTYLAMLPENIKSPKGDFIWHTRQLVDWVNGPTPSFV